MRKPTRKARKFIKRSGKGKGKGKSRFNFLGVMSDQEYSQMFYGGRPFVRRTSGKGNGRRKNPRGSDGNIMKCNFPGCNSEDHFLERLSNA